jgi:putative tryptophan/tyrosine transport system substrate-binding protein
MRRREFITLLAGGAAAWPLAARAQQPAMPVIGYLNPTPPDMSGERLAAFRQGLKDTGYIEGENVSIIYRWADNQSDRMPELASELIRRKVSVIAASSPPAALAAKAASKTIPIVFLVPEDPVKLGLVTSLARPGGNLTGVNFFVAELAAKRLGILHELVPATGRVGLLIDPTYPSAENERHDVETAARSIGLEIHVLNATNNREIDAASAAFVRERLDALYVGSGPLFQSRRVHVVSLAMRHAIPAIYNVRQFPDVGGLISYGSSITDAYRQVGVYTGRILKRAKPADLPVVQSNKLELVINAQTARILGLTIPPSLLSTADEVIE